MVVQPLRIVDAPALLPYRYGLAAVAQPAAIQDPHELFGVQYEQIAQDYTPGVAAGACYTGGSENVSISASAAPYAIGLPFSVYAGVQCSIIGYDEQFILDRARAILKLGWQNAAETALWGGAVNNAPSLAGSGTLVVPGASGVSFTAGLAALEEYMGANYLATAVIHARRDAGPWAAKNFQIYERSGQLQTVLGSQWCFGGGYLNTGPTGVAAPAGSLWMYATGIVQVRLGEAFINGALAENYNRTTDVQTVFAEQQTVLTVDGPTVAVLVNTAL